jgi:GDP-D-mannose dehydratase
MLELLSATGRNNFGASRFPSRAPLSACFPLDTAGCSLLMRVCILLIPRPISEGMTSDDAPLTAGRRHVLLTGSSGSVGSAVLLYLLSRSYTVTSVDIVPLSPATLSQVQPDQHQSYTHHLIDLAHNDKLDALFDSHGPFDGVIHLSAIPSPLFDDARAVHNVNVVAGYNVLKTAVDHGVKRIVQASSVNAPGLSYTPEGRQMFDELPITEETPIRTVSPRAASLIIRWIPTLCPNSMSTP